MSRSVKKFYLKSPDKKIINQDDLYELLCEVVNVHIPHNYQIKQSTSKPKYDKIKTCKQNKENLAKKENNFKKLYQHKLQAIQINKKLNVKSISKSKDKLKNITTYTINIKDLIKDSLHESVYLNSKKNFYNKNNCFSKEKKNNKIKINLNEKNYSYSKAQEAKEFSQRLENRNNRFNSISPINIHNSDRVHTISPSIQNILSEQNRSKRSVCTNSIKEKRPLSANFSSRSTNYKLTSSKLPSYFRINKIYQSKIKFSYLWDLLDILEKRKIMLDNSKYI